jgi:hypothetical protein
LDLIISLHVSFDKQFNGYFFGNIKCLVDTG